MSPSEQLSRLLTRPESRPEPTAPGPGTCHFTNAPADAGREPAGEWESYDLAVLDALLEG
jgi:hypothetical protein